MNHLFVFLVKICIKTGKFIIKNGKLFIMIVKFIIETGKHLFEFGVKAILSQKSKRRGRNGGGFSRDIKLLSGA